jgi:catechol 2,3-dioxygenase-like lactoylglutathione lyase family enzyme
MFKRLHHVAYRCLDAEQTRAFYTDLLGLKFAAALVQDYVPSIAREEPHNHIFFEMADGSFIAFFDILHDTGPAGPLSPDWAQHLALEMESHREAEALSARLRAAGVKVIGPVSHGMCDSWYFYDPNGHRLEMAVRTDSTEMWQGFAQVAPVQMDKWSALKADARP